MTTEYKQGIGDVPLQAQNGYFVEDGNAPFCGLCGDTGSACYSLQIPPGGFASSGCHRAAAQNSNCRIRHKRIFMIWLKKQKNCQGSPAGSHNSFSFLGFHDLFKDIVAERHGGCKENLGVRKFDDAGILMEQHICYDHY